MRPGLAQKFWFKNGPILRILLTKTALLTLALVSVSGALLCILEIMRTKTADRGMAHYCSGLSQEDSVGQIRKNAKETGYPTRDYPATQYSPPILEIQTQHWLRSICTIRHRNGAVISVNFDPWYE